MSVAIFRLCFLPKQSVSNSEKFHDNTVLYEAVDLSETVLHEVSVYRERWSLVGVFMGAKCSREKCVHVFSPK